MGPKATVLQIAPNPGNPEEMARVAHVASTDAKTNQNDEILCSFPDDFCPRGTICMNSVGDNDALIEVLRPDTRTPPVPTPEEPKDDIFKTLMILAVIYNNCFGAGGAGRQMLKDTMEDMSGKDRRPLPKDAINAEEFMNLAGFDKDEVFDSGNPNPVLVAQAQLSMKKMMESMKKR